MRITNNIWRGAGVMLAGVLLSGCDGKESGGGPGAHPAEVNVIKVGLSQVLLTDDLPGRLEAYRVAQVRARVEGIIEKRLFTEGSEVKAGATLFQIDDRSYRAAYAAARADAENAAKTRDRYRELLEVKAVSQQDFEQAVAKLQQAEAALSRAQLDLENTRVPAPISGHIGRELVTVGALVGRGEATNLAVIEQLDRIYATFVQSGAEALRLNRAMAAGKLKKSRGVRVELVLEDGSIYAEKGKLLFADEVVDPGTGSVTIRALFPNPQRELMPGMFAMVRFPKAMAENAIRIPQRAVLNGPQGQYVLVVADGDKVAVRPVKTGEMAGQDFVIEEGLQPGERVVVDGVQKARPGMAVKPVLLDAAEQSPASAVSAPQDAKHATGKKQGA